MIASASIQPRLSSVNTHAPSGWGSKGQSPLVSIGQASKVLGISQQTLRAASNSGALKTYILPSGHRRYSLGDCYAFMGAGNEQATKERPIAVYARVSSAKQAAGFSKGEANNDLARQIESLLTFAKSEYGCAEPQVFKDVGSGISFSESARPGFNRLISSILSGALDGGILIVNYPDRLARVAFDLVKLICKERGIEIRVVNEVPDKDLETEFAEDILHFTHCYSCRLYSRRSAEKLRVTPTADVTKRILELSQGGYAIRAIVASLQKEGVSTDTKGRPITTSVVTRILRENAAVKESLVGKPKVNSFGRFAQQHIKLTGGTGDVLTQHKTIAQHYKNWCAEHNEAPISNGRISRYFKEAGVGGKTHWNGYKVYWGIQLVGLDGQGAWSKERRNETVKERTKASAK